MNAPVRSFQIPIGSLSLTIPANRTVPGLMWESLAFAALLDHEGYDAIARQEVAKVAGWLADQHTAWPGPEPRTGHKLTDGIRPGDEALDWYVARAATRQEDRAEAALVEAGMAVYVPRLTRWRHSARKPKARVDRPLFGGYFFVGLGAGQSIYALVSAEGVHDVVRSAAERNPRCVAFGAIACFLTAEQAGEFDSTRRDRRKDPPEGAPVEIVGGQYQGWPAMFVGRREDERIDVLFKMLGKWNPLVLKPEEVGGLEPEEAA